MPKNPNDPVERPLPGAEPRPEIERESGEPRDGDMIGLDDDEDVDEDVDPDSPHSENDRDDMLTE